MDEQLKQSALAYHQNPKPGKISVTPTKPLSNQLDLSLAYSPGVAAACMAIFDEPLDAQKYTSRANLVGVITNGTAVLGLGNIGPLAAKPVMEGKGCLFKKFAGIDVFDIELAETDPDKLVEAIAMLEPTLGGINLEDIKAPECFYIEKKLRERMKIPVFHDDQHGTAIIASAAILNGLKVVGKKLEEVKLVCSGAGAAAIACLDSAGRPGAEEVEHAGGRFEGRDLRRARQPGSLRRSATQVNTDARTLADAMHDCRRVPRLFERWRTEAGNGRDDGRQAADPRARQSGAGNPPGGREEGAPGLHHRDGPFGLSEPGQQRAVLPVHLPRRARRRRDHDHGSDEARVRARDRGTRGGNRPGR